MMPLDVGMRKASELVRSGQTLQAEVLLMALDQDWPRQIEPGHALSQLALHREDFARAVHWLARCCEKLPDAHPLRLELASALAADGKTGRAIQHLAHVVTADPGAYHAWLLLGELLSKQGHALAALKARYQALTQANAQGQWLSADGVPEHLRAAVSHVVSEIKDGQRELYRASYDSVRAEFGDDALQRMDRALDGYLDFMEVAPPDANQRPKFFFFPDLPPGPYHDPYLQPWAHRVADAFAPVRAEALQVWKEDRELPPFLALTPDAKLDDYLTSSSGKPSWEAFFFFRHGQRYDENHARCPATSRLLESVDLCRIEDQAPEICFSILTPGTKIMPHYGVTNTRLVMHFPLVVPPQCALNVLNHGEHHWKEGELMMFDDTYQHEAWNHSDSARIVLLMDCWNPHLTQPERRAVKLLNETIAGFHASSLIADQAPA